MESGDERTTVIDFEAVQHYVTEHGTGAKSLLHGPAHWHRVERNGLYLAGRTPCADDTVIRLFALFHDSMRLHDGFDQGHGSRGAYFMEECRGTLFQLDSVLYELLFAACRDHTDVDRTDDPTIACCWDADRLDLPRVSKTPQPQFFSTSTGRRLAEEGLRTGSIQLTP